MTTDLYFELQNILSTSSNFFISNRGKCLAGDFIANQNKLRALKKTIHGDNVTTYLERGGEVFLRRVQLYNAYILKILDNLYLSHVNSIFDGKLKEDDPIEPEYVVETDESGNVIKYKKANFHQRLVRNYAIAEYYKDETNRTYEDYVIMFIYDLEDFYRMLHEQVAEYTLANITMPNKMICKCSPAQLGYLFQQLIEQGYIQRPTTSNRNDAEFLLKFFNIDTTPGTLAKELGNENSLSADHKSAFKIPPAKRR